MSNPQARSGWVITTQRQTMVATQNGQFAKGWDIGFRTGLGAEGTVFVPESQFNPQTVGNLVDEKAATLDAISTLTAPPA